MLYWTYALFLSIKLIKQLYLFKGTKAITTINNSNKQLQKKLNVFLLENWYV